MDGHSRKNALYRSKKKEKERKRIESPLVRYNELDQPVCRVCDVVLKFESLWQGHQGSVKHLEAINRIRANAAGLNLSDSVKHESLMGSLKSGPEYFVHYENVMPQPSAESRKSRSASELPSDFFDTNEYKRPNSGPGHIQETEHVISGEKLVGVPRFDSAQTESNGSQISVIQTSKKTDDTENNDKGSLPEGFFDDKDADLRARGIQLVKPDVKDEYKEYEKVIQDDLKEVDDRLEEEEFDAAEVIEEAESLEQKAYKEKVEMIKMKKLELKVARSASHGRGSEVTKVSLLEESSSDDDSDEDFRVDWRAKHV